MPWSAQNRSEASSASALAGQSRASFARASCRSMLTDGRRRRVDELDRLVPEDAAEAEANHGFPQFIAVIDTWSTVAMDTHTKYGTWATATHL